MNLDPTVLRQQIENLKLACPQAWEDGDDVLLADMIEAQTSLREFLTVVVDRMRDAASMGGGIATRIAELELRQRRYEHRERAMRELAFKLMQAANVRKLELPEATLLIRNGSPHVIVTDETLLEPKFIRTKTEVDKGAIRAALKNGERVNGAELSNSEPSLAVRAL